MTLWVDPAVCQAAILAGMVAAMVIGFKWFAPKQHATDADKGDA